MNTDTGQLRLTEQLTESQEKSDKWIPVPKKYEDKLMSMNRKQRKEFLKKNGQFKKGKWGWI